MPIRPSTSLIVLAATVVVSGCPAPQVVSVGLPQSVGFIVESTVTERFGEEVVYELTLDDGTTVTIDERAAHQVAGSTGIAGNRTDLLITGEVNDQRWWLVLIEFGPNQSMPSDCYGLISDGTDEGDTILFDSGLRLPKAAVFDPGGEYADGRYDSPGVGSAPAMFCINPDGEVTAYNV